jgi:ABC-2 type transport system ATP-binding protein
VNDPELVLLDEPTAGLDAMVRRDIYELIENLRAGGRTVLITTHYIEEAERLCDRVAIVNNGQISALGTPRQLIHSSGMETRIEARFSQPVEPERLQKLEGIQTCRTQDGTYLIDANPVAKGVVSLVRFLETEGADLLDLHIAQPTLEDVFVQLTGRSIDD